MGTLILLVIPRVDNKLSKGFQVKIHLHLKICSSGIWFLRMALMVPVLIQFCTSASFAYSNSLSSVAVGLDSFSSVRCFLVVVASIIHDSSCDGSCWLSGWLEQNHFYFTSPGQTCSQETRSSWSALLMSPSGWFPDESAASLGMLVGSGDISSGSWSGWGMDSFWLSVSFPGLYGVLLGLLEF